MIKRLCMIELIIYVLFSDRQAKEHAPKLIIGRIKSTIFPFPCIYYLFPTFIQFHFMAFILKKVISYLYISVCLSVLFSSVCLSVCSSFCLSVRRNICCLPSCVSSRRSLCLIACPPARQHAHPSVRQTVCLSLQICSRYVMGIYNLYNRVYRIWATVAWWYEVKMRVQ